MTEQRRLKDYEDLAPDGGTYGCSAIKSVVAAPERAMKEIDASGLLGRSGSWFPAGRKWALVRNAISDEKYVVCNADEGEPGTCKDQLLMRSKPYLLIEGILIACVLVGARQGIIYLRGEYAEAEEKMREAMANAARQHILGGDLFGSGITVDLELCTGAGSYLCGEETALLESLEGRRGETRMKPPYPGISGLFGKPTLISNVETFCNIPLILRTGSEAYRSAGTPESPGTKLVTVTGCVRKPGVYEIPLGMKIREILELAGGCLPGKQIRAIQTGGGSGPIVSDAALDISFDSQGCRAFGAFLGAGDLMFIPEDADLLELAIRITAFFSRESCGRCVPCRIGLSRMLKLMEAFSAGEGTDAMREEMKGLISHLRRTARCALGTAAVMPAASLLENFPEVFSSELSGEEEGKAWKK